MKEIRKKSLNNKEIVSKKSIRRLSISDGSGLPKTYRNETEEYALVDVCVSSGAGVYREDYNQESGRHEEFYRHLEISEEAIDMTRLLNGCPVLDAHRDRGSVADTIGCVETAWIEGEGQGAKLMATLKLSRISEDDRIVAEKVKNGIITGVSVGAEIHSEKLLSDDLSENGIKRVIADRWEPYEVSLVPVQADASCIIRKKDISTNKGDKMSEELRLSDGDLERIARAVSEFKSEEKNEKESLEKDEERMPEKEKYEEEEETSEEKDDEEQKKEVLTHEMDSEEVSEVASQVAASVSEELPEDLSSEEEAMVSEIVEEEVKKAMEGASSEETVDTLSKKVSIRLHRRLPKIMKPSQPLNIRRKKVTSVKVNSNYELENRKRLIDDMSDAFANKVTHGLYGKTQEKKTGKRFENSEFTDKGMSRLARSLLYHHGHGELAAHGSNAEIYDYVVGRRLERRGSGGPIAVSSDFSNLLTNTMTKSVLASYESKRGEQSFDPFVTRMTVDNFKVNDRVSVGESGELKETAPGADSEIFKMSDSKESYALKSYSKQFQLTRQGFIDDDTGELQTVLNSGAAAADKEADLVYGELVGGQTNGSLWYSAANRNYATGANTALANQSYEGIKRSYELLAQQTGLDVDTPLNLNLGYLLVPTGLHFEALQTKQVQYPALVTSPNPYADMYQIIKEPRLDNLTNNGKGGHPDGATAFYAIAKEAKAFRPFIELGTLSGQPIMKYEEKFSNDVLCWKLTHDVGVKLLDHRLAVKVKGAA